MLEWIWGVGVRQGCVRAPTILLFNIVFVSVLVLLPNVAKYYATTCSVTPGPVPEPVVPQMKNVFQLIVCLCVLDSVYRS